MALQIVGPVPDLAVLEKYSLREQVAAGGTGRKIEILPVMKRPVRGGVDVFQQHRGEFLQNCPSGVPAGDAEADGLHGLVRHILRQNLEQDPPGELIQHQLNRMQLHRAAGEPRQRPFPGQHLVAGQNLHKLACLFLSISTIHYKKI